MLLARDIVRRPLDNKVVSAWLRYSRYLAPSATLAHSTSLGRPSYISTTPIRAVETLDASPNSDDGEDAREPLQTGEHASQPLRPPEALDVVATGPAAMTGHDKLSKTTGKAKHPRSNPGPPNALGFEYVAQRTPFARLIKTRISKTVARDDPNKPPDQNRKRAPLFYKNVVPMRKGEIPFEKTIGTVSPTGALRIYLNAISKGGLVDETEWNHLEALFVMMPDRLPIVTAQALLRQRAAEGKLFTREQRLPQLLSDIVWSGRFFREAAGDGRVSDEMIKEWALIISVESSDDALEMFLASDAEKPFFLLNILLDQNRLITNPRLFDRLLQYLHRHYVDGMPEPGQVDTNHEFVKLPQLSLVRLLRRLIHHSLGSFPTLLPSVAKFVGRIIEAQAARTGGGPGVWHKARCELFNQALYYFSYPASFNTIGTMAYNWEAQKELLKLSSRMNPPVFIGKHGFQAIRKVMLALKKTPSEREVAKRAAKTWPPYARIRDGRDESLRPEDSQSRSARAGLLKVEAGYPDDHVDRALDVLGGSRLGQTPTIQTRTLAPRTLTGRNAGLNVFAEWCARIEATRNTREAWEAFSRPPRPDLRPNASVYAEVFDKLFAREAISGGQSDPLPGDTRRVFPVDDGNLSAFEIARITPPTSGDLYETMRRSGVRPVGNCLNVLVQHAPSKREAAKYLVDGQHSQLAYVLQNANFIGQHSADVIGAMPRPLLRAWVAMLCSSHERSRRGQIEEAINLVKAFELRSPGEGFDKTTWQSILEALAGQKVTYGTQLAAMNAVRTLDTFLSVWEKFRWTAGFSPSLFEQLARIISKTLRLSVFRDTKARVTRHHSAFTPLSLRHHLHRAYAWLEYCFVVDFKTSVCSPQDGTTTLVYRITAWQVFLYMQALCTMGDVDGAVRLMDWLLDAWDRDDVLQEAKDPREPEYREIIAAISCFDGIARRMVDADRVDIETLGRLASRLEKLNRERACTWFWSAATEDDERFVNLNAILESRYKFPPRTERKKLQWRRLADDKEQVAGGQEVSEESGHESTRIT